MSEQHKSLKLTPSEQFAEKILDALGWKPKKIRPTRNSDNVGIPDFECSEDRYVEVKKGQPNKQIQAWTKLIEDGKEVYLMYVYKKSIGYAYRMYRVTFLLEEISDVSSLEKLTCRICGAKVDWLHHGDLCDKCSKTWEKRESNFEVW